MHYFLPTFIKKRSSLEGLTHVQQVRSRAMYWQESGDMICVITWGDYSMYFDTLHKAIYDFFIIFFKNCVCVFFFFFFLILGKLLVVHI